MLNRMSWAHARERERERGGEGKYCFDNFKKENNLVHKRVDGKIILKITLGEFIYCGFN